MPISASGEEQQMQNRIDKLYQEIVSRRGADPASSRTARLLCRGRNRKGRKLCEEALETVIAFLEKDRTGVIEESVDVLYHLAILWADLGVTPGEIWAEMDRRTELLGLAEKLPRIVPLRRARRIEARRRARSPAA
jgi:phosphoribosyl-ATP pyrophosphohydrolase